MSTSRLATFAGLAAAVVVGAALMVNLSTAGDKHIICHFDGQAGTTKFQQIECGSGCVNGHFESGNPKAGHELDILDPAGGVCPGGPPPSPTP